MNCIKKMKKNEFISYRIKNINTSKNNEDSKDITDISPIRSYEFKIAQIKNFKSFDIKNIKKIRIKHDKENNDFFHKLQKIKQSKHKLSALKDSKKKSNIIYFNNIQCDRQINDISTLFKEKEKKIECKNNKKSLIKKLKKFNSCKNLILGKYPIGHRLLLPIRHYFKIDNKNANLKEFVTIKKKNKKDIYIIEENTEYQNTKGKNMFTNNKKRKKIKTEKEKDKEEIKIEMKKEIKNENKIETENKNEENKEKNDINKNNKVEIAFKIKRNKKENKIEKPFTIADKISRINEYSDKIKKMYTNRLIRKSKEINSKEENIKEKTFEISHINDIMELKTTNRNPKNTLDKIEHKSNSMSHIFDIKPIENVKQKYLKPIKFIINNNNKENNKENNQNIISNNNCGGNNTNNKTEINNKKEEIKIIKENKENKENKEENSNSQIKENKNDSSIEKNNKVDSLIINKENTIKRKSYLTKDELLERLIKIRKEYLEKEKNQSTQKKSEYYFLIFKGNASYLIRNCMNHRVNWKEPFSNVTSFFNFKWTELSQSLDYSSLGTFYNNKQIVNHFEHHFAISNKANMFFNLMDYCEKNKLSVFKYVPFTIVYRIKDRSRYSDENKEIRRKKNLKNLKIFIEKTDSYLKRYEEIGNYFENNEFVVNNKINLENENDEDIFNVKNVEESSMCYSDVFQNFDKYKREFSKNDKKGKLIKIGKNTMIEIPLSHFSYRNLWVIKAINLNRGMCIKVVNNFTEMEKIIEKFRQGVNYGFTKEAISEEETKEQKDKDKEKDNKKKEEEENTYYCDNIIIQKYIEYPLLYKGRKFDMRIWVLLTHQMKVYIFKEGHLKTCSIEYNMNSKDSFCHITNYSFQKKNDNFSRYEIGNEVPFYEFQKYLDEKYPEKKYNIKNDLMKKMKEIIELTMQSGKNKINSNNRNYQFEIFGYDFMLDQDFNVFLIEINTNPGLEESSPWIKIIIPRMLDDALRLTLDQLFETKYDFNLNYKNEENIENYRFVLRRLKNRENPNLKYCENYSDIIENDKDENINENILIENEKNNNEKKQKYISPFPVPGYNLSENLWEFVCDLNEKNVKENKSENEAFTGIKHLLKKKIDKSKNENL